MMGAYIPTQIDINALYIRARSVRVKAYIIDMNYKTLKLLQGNLIDENRSIDVDSDIRKTMTLSMLIRDNETDFGENKSFWINRLVKIVYVMKGIRGEELTYNQGIYVLSDYILSHTTSTSQIDFKLNDLVSLYNGDAGGSLIRTLTTTLYMSELDTTRDAMIAIMSLAGITKYNISSTLKDFPYDLEFTSSQTIWDMIKKVRDLYPGWEAFFDIDGTFVFQEIPTCADDPIVLNSNVLEKIFIPDGGENVTCDVFGVKNVTKIWGKCLDTDYYATTCTYSSGVYTATFESLPVETDGTISTGIKLAIHIPDVNLASPTVIIKNTVSGTTTTVATLHIVDDDEVNLTASKLKADTTYVFRYRRSKLFLMGEWQIVGVCALVASEPTSTEKAADIVAWGTDNIYYTVNPDSPFCREYVSERTQVLSGGNYDNIYSQQNVLETCELRNWESARTSYNATVNCVFIPFLFGNEKIGYKLKSTKEDKEWIVKKISGSWLSGKMALTLNEFYPMYPNIISK